MFLVRLPLSFSWCHENVSTPVVKAICELVKSWFYKKGKLLNI
jgi:hypothetical protein